MPTSYRTCCRSRHLLLVHKKPYDTNTYDVLKAYESPGCLTHHIMYGTNATWSIICIRHTNLKLNYKRENEKEGER